jgi:hypothetical protein
LNVAAGRETAETGKNIACMDAQQFKRQPYGNSNFEKIIT